MLTLGDPYLSAPSCHSPQSVYPKHEIKLRERCFPLSGVIALTTATHGPVHALQSGHGGPAFTPGGRFKGFRNPRCPKPRRSEPARPPGEPNHRDGFWEGRGREGASHLCLSEQGDPYLPPQAGPNHLQGRGNWQISAGVSKEKPWLEKKERQTPLSPEKKFT